MDKSVYLKFSDAQIGDTYERPVLVSSIVENTAKNGKTFVRLTLKDGFSEITAMMFDTSAAALESVGIVKSSVADVYLAVSEYNGGKSFKVNEIRPAADKTLSAADFTKLPPVDLDVMYNEICEIIKNASAGEINGSAPISELALTILEANKKKFMFSSAAVSMHHDLKGGLLYHSYRMVKAADALCNIYDTLDRELLVCGAALHDIGKIWEYKTSEAGDAEYTASGILLGHLYIGASLIKQYTKDDEGNEKYDNEKVKMLVHMILSHHGTHEFGAVTCPAIPEAFALHYIDNIDAKIYMCEDFYESLQPGEITDKKPFGLDNRIYRPKFK